MGLDNGIEIRRNEKSMNIYDKIQRFESDWDKEHNCDFEICYWRKCWQVRNLIFRCLTVGDNEYEILIKREDIPNIINALESLNKKTWDEDMSIWTWEEQRSHIKQHIKNLNKANGIYIFLLEKI